MGEYLSTPIKDQATIDKKSMYLEYGICTIQGCKKRLEIEYAEDFSKEETEGICIIAMYQGHNGKEISQFLKNHFTKELIDHPSFLNGREIAKALKETCIKMDKMLEDPQIIKELNELRAKNMKEKEDKSYRGLPKSNIELLKTKNEIISNIEKSESNNVQFDDIPYSTGSSLCVCVFDFNYNKIYCCNLGDSSIVIKRKNCDAEVVTVKHNTENRDELKRIDNAKGIIFSNRINGSLNVTRSIGDLNFKKDDDLDLDEQIIIPIPDIQVKDITNDINFVAMFNRGVAECVELETCSNVLETWLFNEVGMSQEPNNDLDPDDPDPGKSPISFVLKTVMEPLISTNINESGKGCENMGAAVIKFLDNE